MAVRPNEAARNAVLDDGLDHFDGATITLYTGTQPSAGGGATGETALGSGTMPTPAFAAASGGARAVASNWNISITSDGTVGWARIAQGGAVIDVDAGEGAGTLSLDETAVTDGDTVQVTGGTGVSLPGDDA